MAIPAEEVFRKTMTIEQRALADKRSTELIAQHAALLERRKQRALASALAKVAPDEELVSPPRVVTRHK